MSSSHPPSSSTRSRVQPGPIRGSSFSSTAAGKPTEPERSRCSRFEPSFAPIVVSPYPLESGPVKSKG